MRAAERAVDVASIPPPGLKALPKVHEKKNKPAGLVVPTVSSMECSGFDWIKQIACRVSPVDADVAVQDTGDVPDTMNALHYLLKESRPFYR
jgi:hypothetical protein